MSSIEGGHNMSAVVRGVWKVQRFGGMPSPIVLGKRGLFQWEPVTPLVLGVMTGSGWQLVKGHRSAQSDSTVRVLVQASVSILL